MQGRRGRTYAHRHRLVRGFGGHVPATAASKDILRRHVNPLDDRVCVDVDGVAYRPAVVHCIAEALPQLGRLGEYRDAKASRIDDGEGADVKSSQESGALAGIVAVLLVVGLVAVALVVIRHPQHATTGAGGGLTCQGRPSFVMDDAGASLFALAAVSQQDVCAVGTRDAHAAIVHWDGRSWRDAPLPALGATSSALSAVEAIGPRDVWAVGRADLAP